MAYKITEEKSSAVAVIEDAKRRLYPDKPVPSRSTLEDDLIYFNKCLGADLHEFFRAQKQYKAPSWSDMTDACVFLITEQRVTATYENGNSYNTIWKSGFCYFYDGESNVYNQNENIHLPKISFKKRYVPPFDPKHPEITPVTLPGALLRFLGYFFRNLYYLPFLLLGIGGMSCAAMIFTETSENEKIQAFRQAVSAAIDGNVWAIIVPIIVFTLLVYLFIGGLISLKQDRYRISSFKAISSYKKDLKLAEKWQRDWFDYLRSHKYPYDLFVISDDK